MCVDLIFLNRAVTRENHPIPVVEHTLGQMPGAKYFSKLDCRFWQVPLSKESQLLTIFITPFHSEPEDIKKWLKFKILRDLRETWYLGVFGVANSESDVKKTKIQTLLFSECKWVFFE